MNNNKTSAGAANLLDEFQSGWYYFTSFPPLHHPCACLCPGDRAGGGIRIFQIKIEMYLVCFIKRGIGFEWK